MQKIDSFVQHAIVPDRIFGISRHIEHSHFRPPRCQLPRKLPPIHPRHDHVCQQKMNRSAMPLRLLHGLDAVSGFDHGVSLSFQ